MWWFVISTCHCTDQFMVIPFSKLRIKLGLKPLEIPDSSADTEGKVHLCTIYVTGQFSFQVKVFQPFKPQYQHTNSPNWSLYISLKNELREFDNRSKHSSSMIISLILITLSLDKVCIHVSLGENWCWSPLGLKGLTYSVGWLSMSFVGTEMI